MSRFLPEPPHTQGQPHKTALVLVNLGTPDAPSRAALRRYLDEFLWDPRVVEIPRPLWWLILKTFILNFRPGKSAAKYARIWQAEGSPLKLHSERQAQQLQHYFAAQPPANTPSIHITWAMRYGQPSLANMLRQLKQQGYQRLLIAPLYPQYAASTTASVIDVVAQWQQSTRNLPELRFIRSFAQHPAYIAALADSVRQHWATHGPLGAHGKLIMSFHGLPAFSLQRGDPYYFECQSTAHLLAAALQLEATQWQLTFQSRFGRAEWLQPYTQATLEQLGASGLARVDVICPGFVSDCLETLEEIAIECRAAFVSQGGGAFHYIPCLNENPAWISALAMLSREHLADWLSPLSLESNAAARATAHGAKT